MHVNRIALVLFLVGLVFVTAGAAMIYHPLGLIIPGALFMFIAGASLKSGRKK